MGRAGCEKKVLIMKPADEGPTPAYPGHLSARPRTGVAVVRRLGGTARDGVATASPQEMLRDHRAHAERQRTGARERRSPQPRQKSRCSSWFGCGSPPLVRSLLTSEVFATT